MVWAGWRPYTPCGNHDGNDDNDDGDDDYDDDDDDNYVDNNDDDDDNDDDDVTRLWFGNPMGSLWMYGPPVW